METNPLPRPRQVTLAGWLIMVGSVFVIATVFERIAGLQSLETQRSVQRFLSEPPGDGLGVGLTEMLDLIRLISMVAAGCAAAAGVLGFHVLRRNRSARVALSVLAVPLFLSGLVAGGFMSSIVAAAAVMLWFQPSRDWFDGIAAPKPQAAGSLGGLGWPTEGRGSDRPVTPTPTHRSEGAHAAAASSPSVSSLLDRSGRSGISEGRPGALVGACVLTFLGAGFALVLGIGVISILASSPDLILEEARKNPDLADFSNAEVISTLRVSAGVIIAWSAAALLLVVLALRRMSWARIGLLVSATTSALLFLVAVFGQAVMVVPLALSLTVVIQLLRAEVRDWFAEGKDPRLRQ